MTTTEEPPYGREFWATEGARLYDAHGDEWEVLDGRFGAAMLAAAGLRPGERVLDVGCGWGSSTIDAAGQVAPGGEVVGVDISGPMLARARERVAATGRGNVTLVEADAQTYPFEPGWFDAVISRFGVMFFADPAAAFGNLHRALRPGGRLCFVCQQDPTRDQWIAVALSVVVPLVGQAPELFEPGAPGPFAFADGQRLRWLLAAGGFAEVTLETVTRQHVFAATAADAAELVLAQPESQLLLAGAPEQLVARASVDLRAAFEPYAGPSGVVMDTSVWLATARK